MSTTDTGAGPETSGEVPTHVVFVGYVERRATDRNEYGKTRMGVLYAPEAPVPVDIVNVSVTEDAGGPAWSIELSYSASDNDPIYGVSWDGKTFHVAYGSSGIYDRTENGEAEAARLVGILHGHEITGDLTWN